MKIVRITLAVDDLDRMSAFYNDAFHCDLQPIGGLPVHRGSLGGVELQLCANSLAGVVAEQGRHQLRLAVQDAELVAASVAAAGGTVIERSGSEDAAVIAMADPEGNTMELVPE